MDTRAHQRFLDYLELWDRFHPKDFQKLDRESFVAHDREFLALGEKERKGELDADSARRIVALRRVLLRD